MSIERAGAPVLAAHRWNTNADLIADVARLGYLRPEWLTLDPTHGRGNWWTRWSPERLITHDLALDGVDFRDLPEDDATFDAIAFDPPYVCVGGRSTTTIADLHDRYGLTDAPTTPVKLQALIDAGLIEMHRVLKPHGVLLVKCADYVSSGRVVPGTHYTLAAALALGLTLQNSFIHVGLARPQPPRRQVHARNNFSILYVLKKPRSTR